MEGNETDPRGKESLQDVWDGKSGFKVSSGRDGDGTRGVAWRPSLAGGKAVHAGRKATGHGDRGAPSGRFFHKLQIAVSGKEKWRAHRCIGRHRWAVAGLICFRVPSAPIPVIAGITYRRHRPRCRITATPANTPRPGLGGEGNAGRDVPADLKTAGWLGGCPRRRGEAGDEGAS